MNLAGMIRVSTEGQVDAFGKEVQHDAIQRWADLNGHTITEWFEEDAISGKTDGGERPALAELLSRANEFDGVAFFDATRIARRSVVQETLLGLVWATGLKVFTSTAGELAADEDDPTKILVRQILAVIAEFDHRSTVKRLHAARKIKSSQGGYVGGTPMYGKAVVGTGKAAQFIKDEVESETIEFISTAHQQGMSLREIVRALNTANIPTKMGKSWSPEQVRRIIQRSENT